MNISKKRTIPLAVILLVLGILGTGYFILIGLNRAPDQNELLDEIPGDAFAVLHVKDPVELWEQLTNTSYWKHLLSVESLRQVDASLRSMDSVIHEHQKFLDLAGTIEPLVSFHTTGDGHIGVLCLMGISSKMQRIILRNLIQSALGANGTVSWEHGNRKVYRLDREGSKRPFYMAFTRNTFLLSADSLLINQGLEPASRRQDKMGNDPAFRSLLRTAGKKVPAHLYIHFARTGKAFFLLTDTVNTIQPAAFFFPEGWSVLDVTIKEKELLINGFAATGEPHSRFSQFIMRQKPQVLSIPNILPYNTGFAIVAGIDQFDDYLSIALGMKPGRDSATMTLKAPVDLERRMAAIAGHEMCLAYLDNPGSLPAQNAYLVIRAADTPGSLISLEVLSDDSENYSYNGIKILKLKTDNPFRAFFDPIPEDNPLTCFTHLGDYFVFGESTASIQRFISYYLAGRTLGNNASFRNFFDNFPETANISYFLNFRYAGGLLEQFLTTSTIKALDDGSVNLESFDGLGLHFSSMEKQAYTSLHLNHDPFHTRELPYLWKTALDAGILSGPFLVRSESAEHEMILVFDSLNQMVMVDGEGKILWKYPLAEAVISPVYEVHYYKDNRIQYLFNTTGQLILINGNGKPVGDYPINLKEKATSGILVSDYEKNMDYRIIFCNENREIINLDLKGKPVKGWNPPLLAAPVRVPAQHLMSGSKDYLIFPMENGQVLMTDRRGQTRIRIEEAFVNSTRTVFFANRSGGQFALLTSDVYGNLIQIPATGHVNKIKLGDFLPDHYFTYMDFDRNNSPDYIFVDRNQLWVFNKDRKMIYNIELQSVIDMDPVVYPVRSKGSYLGLQSGADGRIYIFDREGLVPWCSDLSGNKPMAFGRVRSDEELNLVTGTGNTILLYRVE